MKSNTQLIDSDCSQNPTARSPKEVLKQSHPQQNTFVFDHLTFSSCFDSGNMARCAQGSKNFYTINISEDVLPYSSAGHYRTWFYFSVKGAKMGETLTFQVRSMNNQGKLYKSGLRPVYRILPSIQKSWKRVPNEVVFDYASDGFYITFNFTFSHENNETAYFAFTYPYSFEESLKKSLKLQEKYQNHDEIYFHREVLTNSIEDRPMELLTLTRKTKITNQREDLIPNLFPQHQNDESNRPFKFEKPTIFLTSRVHPGETPASYVLNGILNFLTNEKSEQARILLDNFVFKIIPMLNPDGVYRGYYRLDTKNQNLNRYYIDPSPTLQPTIYAAKQAIIQQHQNQKLFLYVDLHAHASKKGCFMFGNSLTGESQLKNMLLPKLISMNSLNFDFVECSFSEKMMNVKDKKDGLSREGSGRVSIYKATELPHCYTLECNYAGGRRINHLAQKQVKATGEIEPELPITDIHSRMYTENKTPPYTIEIFEDVGRAFCIGILDYIEKNPVSRIPLSNHKTLENIKNDILAHNRILIPKKRPDQKENEKKPLSSKYVQRSQTVTKQGSQKRQPVQKQQSFQVRQVKKESLESENISNLLDKLPENDPICEKDEYIEFESEGEGEEDKENSSEVYNNYSRSQVESKSSERPQYNKFVRNVTEKRKHIDDSVQNRRKELRNQSVNVHKIQKDSSDYVNESDSTNTDQMQSKKNIIVFQNEIVSSANQPIQSTKSYQKTTKAFLYQMQRQTNAGSRGGPRSCKDSQNQYNSQTKALGVTQFRMPTPPEQKQEGFNKQSFLKKEESTKLPEIVQYSNLRNKAPIQKKVLADRSPIFNSQGIQISKNPRNQSENVIARSSAAIQSKNLSNQSVNRKYQQQQTLSPKFLQGNVLQRVIKHNQAQMDHMIAGAAE